ncbi:transposase [Streptomyces sp. NPDC000618]|uniref:transposase n=1 Tax=Streptomyces sp. NPDC000618 TaxID=3154265 RepID=UPI003320E9C7
MYYPLHATPCTLAHHFTRGRSDPAFRTKPQLAAALAARGKAAGFGCRAVVADCAYSVSDDWYLALREAGLAYVVVLKPRNLVGCRCLPGRLRSRLVSPAGCGHHRPDRPCRRKPPGTWPPTCPPPTHPTPRPFCNRQPTSPRLCSSSAAAVDRAGLQAGQGTNSVDRLPGLLRPRHPSPPDPAELRLLLLLGPMVRPARTPGCHRTEPLPRRGPERGPVPSH